MFKIQLPTEDDGLEISFCSSGHRTYGYGIGKNGVCKYSGTVFDPGILGTLKDLEHVNWEMTLKHDVWIIYLGMISNSEPFLNLFSGIIQIVLGGIKIFDPGK